MKTIQLIYKMRDKEIVKFKGMLKNIQKKQSGLTVFWTAIFCDKTGQISCKVWDEQLYQLLKDGGVFEIIGEINDWNGQRSINIKDINKIFEDFSSYMPQVENIDKLMNRILKAISKLDKQRPYYQITNYLMQKNLFKFEKHPAAKSMHHDLIGGLVLHTTSMLCVGYRLFEEYSNLGFNLDWDLLASGIILHDLAKIEEISFKSGMIDYSLKGQLLGHIVMGVEFIDEAVNALKINDDEAILLLKHLILSHHGKEEWGSPKKPMIPEAILLHHIDLLDSQMNRCFKMIDTMNEGEIKLDKDMILYKTKRAT